MNVYENFFSDKSNEWIHSGAFDLKSKLLKDVSEGAVGEIEESLSKYIEGYRAYADGDVTLTYQCFLFLWAQVSAVATNNGLDDLVANSIKQRYYLGLEEAETVDEMIELCRGIVLELTYAMDNQKIENSYSPLIRECCAYIRRNIEEKLTVDSIAEALHFSDSYISHKFKEETNMTISDFILREKISEAKLLIKKHVPISRVAQTLGFCSQSHFAKQFKRETGLSPSQYKNK